MTTIKKMYFFLLVICFISTSWAQGEINIYGSSDIQTGSIDRLSTGEKVISGINEVNGISTREMFITKVSAAGNILLDKRYGISWNQYNFRAIATSDGGFFGAGMIFPSNQKRDILTVKIDSVGDVTWARRIGGGNDEWYGDIAETPAGNFIVAGYSTTHGTYASPVPAPSQPDAILVELSSTGALNWAYSYGSSYGDKFYRIKPTNSGYIIAGRAWKNVLDGYFVVTDSLGVPSKKLRLWTSSPERIFDVIETSDGGYLLTGHYKLGNQDVLVIKLSAAFDIQWSKTYSTPGSEYAVGLLEKGGNYYISGSINTFSGNYDALMMKTDLSGNLVWARTYDRGGLDYGKILYDDGGANILGGMSTVSLSTGKSDMATISFTDALDSCAMDVTSLITTNTHSITLSNYGGSVNVSSSVPVTPFTVTSINGNLVHSFETCSISDTTAPVIICPGDLVLECQDEIVDGTIDDVIAIDDFDPNPIVALSQTDNGATGCAGDPLIISRVFTAQDSSGNTSSCTQTITVESTPIIATPSPNQFVFPAYPDSSCTEIGVSVIGGCYPYTFLWNTGETSANIQVCPNVSTVYSVIITDAQGCVQTSQVSVCAIDITCQESKNGKSQPKIMICHKPAGNPSNSQTLCLPLHAAIAHLSNGHGGDHLGSCGSLASRYCETIPNNQLPIKKPKKVIKGGFGTLLQVYPNPFSESITFEVQLESEENVSMSIIDIHGRAIKQIQSGNLREGLHEFKWNGQSELGQMQANGVYFLNMTIGDQREVKRIMLMR